jgi:hypothetical protein
MEDKSISAGLTSDQLARLWSLGSDCARELPGADADQKRRDVLLDYLASSLPPDPALIEILPKILGHLCQQLRPFSGESLQALLLDPGTNLAVFERIKDRAKELGDVAADGAQREAALALYFAAIAGALLHHGTKISQHSRARLEQSFRTLSQQAWIPADLADLFTRAVSCCRKKR